jgi:translation initiation factor 2 alpha subunit (eIF-2alpha)
MSEKEKAPVSEMFDQAMKNYEQAFRTGMKFQEEAGRWWMSIVQQSTAPQDVQRRMCALASEMAGPTQKRMEEVLETVSQSNRTGIGLFQKAMDAAQTRTPSESQAKWVELWEGSLNATRNQIQAYTQIGGKALNCWLDLVRKGAVDATAAKSSAS